MFAIKRNNGFPGTMILAPRSGRVIIEGIPNKDDRWREKFFVFKVNLASVGDFDFERIPMEWSDDIGNFFFFANNVCSGSSFGLKVSFLFYLLSPSALRP